MEGLPVARVDARLAEAAARAPEQVALRWQDRTITYGDLDRRVDAAAGTLRALGLEPGDRVAIALGTVPAFVEAYYGTLRAGGVAVPVDPELAPPEVAYILSHSGTRIAVVAADLVEVVREHVPTVVAVGADVAGVPRWAELLEAAPTATPVPRAEEDLAALVYTSGTTGRPRGAMLTHRNLTANQDQSLSGRMRITPEDVVLLVLPLSHIYALNVGLGAGVRAGATLVLVERFQPHHCAEVIAEHGVTVVLGAPPMYLAWLDLDGVDLSSVRLAVSGAAPLPVPVFHRAREQLGLTIWEGYGLTEASPSVTSNAMADEPRPGSVGLPLPGVELRIVDDDGEDVERGDPGEVWVRGPNVFVGYWNDPEATAEALTEDGWLRTGDIGTQDEDGFLYLVDRKRDLIIVSGFNVYPREVEQVLESHPDVLACAVVGIPHPYTGEAVKAVVVPRPGAELSAEELIRFAARHLARYKCPEVVEFADELPHTATGKVRRGALREGA